VKVSAVTPILNVSDIAQTFQWFEKLGWKKGFEWGEPAGFGSVCAGKNEIFLCHDGQGSRGKGSNTTTFNDPADETIDKGVWMSVWVDSVDEVYKLCQDAGIEITFEPTDMPWGVREMHIRHDDGHVFRITQGL